MCLVLDFLSRDIAASRSLRTPEEEACVGSSSRSPPWCSQVLTRPNMFTIPSGEWGWLSGRRTRAKGSSSAALRSRPRRCPGALAPSASPAVGGGGRAGSALGRQIASRDAGRAAGGVCWPTRNGSRRRGGALASRAPDRALSTAPRAPGRAPLRCPPRARPLPLRCPPRERHHPLLRPSPRIRARPASRLTAGLAPRPTSRRFAAGRPPGSACGRSKDGPTVATQSKGRSAPCGPRLLAGREREGGKGCARRTRSRSPRVGAKQSRKNDAGVQEGAGLRRGGPPTSGQGRTGPPDVSPLRVPGPGPRARRRRSRPPSRRRSRRPRRNPSGSRALCLSRTLAATSPARARRPPPPPSPLSAGWEEGGREHGRRGRGGVGWGEGRAEKGGEGPRRRRGAYSAMSSSSASGRGMLAASASWRSYSACWAWSTVTSGGARATCSTKWRLGSPTSLRAR